MVEFQCKTSIEMLNNAIFCREYKGIRQTMIELHYFVEELNRISDAVLNSLSNGVFKVRFLFYYI